jgi:hypothetical protein
MGKIRRDNLIFITWKGDHSPYHVHVYRDGKLLVKWDLENEFPMKGKISTKVLTVIKQLQSEGLL